jgi:uncharacterized membrane protein YphA (DoxX/SURF4 family)
MFKKISDQISRFFVGGLFIFSGLIKLNDPIGTEIKMEEYFEVFAENFGSFFHFFIPYAMEIGFIMIVLEIVLGVAVLIFYKMEITTLLLLILMVFFTFLTGYSAITNAVTDCGCFGDAIKLTPWQSFYKDIILMFPVLHLFWYRRTYTPVLRSREGHAVIIAVTVLCTFLGVYAVMHLPFIDFRAYRVGNNIPKQMEPEEQPKFEYVFKRKDNGDLVNSEKYLTDTTLYKYESVRQTNEDKTKANITDYSVTSVDGEDVTAQTFQGNKLLLIIIDVDKASVKNIGSIKKLIDELDGKIDIMALTSSSGEKFETFRHEHQLAVSYYFTDATVLKTIIRSNPGIALWKDGTVLGNWHHNDTPEASEVLNMLK